jgi:hypothetical protein
MRGFAILFAAICGLPHGAGADESALSCAELAEQRAERQFAEDSAALEDRHAGQIRDNALQRDLLRLDAESYRTRVYRNCLKLRDKPELAEPPPAAD